MKSRGDGMAQGSGNLRSAREDKVRAELHRVRNTFSFRLGLLLTESFIRKPWLLPLLPFRLIALFFHKTIPYKTSSQEGNNKEKDGGILIFCTSEEGMASLERCEGLSKKYITGGKKVIMLSSSSHSNRLLDNEIPFFALPDPKSTSMNTREWNDTCLDLMVSIIEGNNVGTIIFDGPYPYRGVLNSFEIYPEIHTVWRRPAYSPATNEEQISRFDALETDWLDAYHISTIHPRRTREDGELLHLLMGLGYNRRNGIAKRTPAIITHLERLPKMRISIPEHLTISESAFGLTSISRWDTLASNPELDLLDAAVIPPEPQLIKLLTARQIPTLVVTTGNIQKQLISQLRRVALNHPLLVLDDPDGEELRLALGTLVSGTMQVGNVLPRI